MDRETPIWLLEIREYWAQVVRVMADESTRTYAPTAPQPREAATNGTRLNGARFEQPVGVVGASPRECRRT